MINAGGESITVLITRTRSRCKITYRPDAKYVGRIRATVPYFMPPKDIEKFFAERFGLLKEQLNRSKESMCMHGFASGEFVPFFGSNLLLKVRRIADSPQKGCRHEISSGEFILDLLGEYATDPNITDNSAFRGICAQEVRLRACGYINKYASAMDVRVGKLTVRDMDSRWGSVRPKQYSMSLASKLFMYPECCLEAVVVHELAHYKYLNHSQLFYDRMTEFLPSWRGPDALLDSKTYPYERMARLRMGENEPLTV